MKFWCGNSHSSHSYSYGYPSSSIVMWSFYLMCPSPYIRFSLPWFMNLLWRSKSLKPLFCTCGEDSLTGWFHCSFPLECVLEFKCKWNISRQILRDVIFRICFKRDLDYRVDIHCFPRIYILWHKKSLAIDWLPL